MFSHSPRIAWKTIILLLILSFIALAQERNKEYTVDDIYANNKFSSAGRGVKGFQWMPDGKSYSSIEADTVAHVTNVWVTDVASGKKTEVIDGSKLVLNDSGKPFQVGTYFWSEDAKKVMFTGSLTARSMKTGGNIFLFDLSTGKFSQLTNSDEEQMNEKFSPDGRMIGFVRANNLFTVDLASGTETQLTTDGREHVLNGHFDWVYEEEFSIIDGWQWSPDGKSIAYWQLDENRVPDYPIMNFLPLHEDVTRYRYPLPGDHNSMVRVGVVGIESKKTVWANIGEPFDTAQDTYVPRIAWTPKGKLLIHKLNRNQNNLDLYLIDPSTGDGNIILTEHETTWVDIKTDYVLLKRSDRFIWSSGRDGFVHLYLFDLDGTLIRQLTKGKWDVEKCCGVDEGRGLVYFIAGRESPLVRDLYAVPLEGGEPKRITSGAGTHGAAFSPTFAYFQHTFSNVTTPARTELMRTDGSVVRVLNPGTIKALDEYPFSPQEFFSFKTSDGVELNGWMIKPLHFDPAGKYPVLMYVYGGPGSQTVQNQWGGAQLMWYQLLAQKGYIIVSVDNRGTGARGKEFMSVVYKHLGKWESHDQVEGAKYLASLPYVDGSRIGIWGWSYGGYMTLMSLLEGGEIFKAGVAVAPVTNWKFYDSIYTERYMLTPALNPDGYEESAPANKAKDLKSKLLEIHGTADDNVHWANTVTMVDGLIKAGKQFETAFYPGGYHGIGGGKVRAQLFTKITNYLLENL